MIELKKTPSFSHKPEEFTFKEQVSSQTHPLSPSKENSSISEIKSKLSLPLVSNHQGIPLTSQLRSLDQEPIHKWNLTSETKEFKFNLKKSLDEADKSNSNLFDMEKVKWFQETQSRLNNPKQKASLTEKPSLSKDTLLSKQSMFEQINLGDSTLGEDREGTKIIEERQVEEHCESYCLDQTISQKIEEEEEQRKMTGENIIVLDSDTTSNFQNKSRFIQRFF